jgi:hypothetical protein
VGDETGSDCGGTIITLYDRMKAMPKLLILSSDPRGNLNLKHEISDLVSAIQRSERFELCYGFEVSSQRLFELLEDHSPQFVHFCGHGDGEKGLVFQDENGKDQPISTETLARIFKTFSKKIHCTVLNACETDHQAEAIARQIPYVVGMRQPILDQAAYHFAVSFYKGLAAGTTIEQACQRGCTAIQIYYETQSQSNQSRQYRKLTIVGEEVQSASHPLPEYPEPELWKDGIRWTPDSGQYVSPDRPEAFVEFVQQEIDRKEYKDRARAAYDNFGLYSAQNVTSRTQSEFRQRKIFLSRVKEFWIEGYLKPSLKDTAVFRLDLEPRPDAITDLTQGIEALDNVNLDESFKVVRPTEIYEEIGQGRTLLILGDPGAGKTIALLQLAQRLIERIENNLQNLPMPPMPVVFNLSSWAREQKPILNWLIDELQEKYKVQKSLSKPWIMENQLILLLDGLDEVEEVHRKACVEALNQFIGDHLKIEVAVCSRMRDYEALTVRLQISSALCLQPISSEQVYKILDKYDGLTGVKALLRSNRELEQFAQTPLILNFMIVAYNGWSVERLIPQLRASSKDRDQNLFNTYIDRRLGKDEAPEYSKAQVQHWLIWLAKRMKQEKRTIFLIERMQPSWLQNDIEIRIYRKIFLILSVLIVGAIGSGFGKLIFIFINGKVYDQLFWLSGGICGGLIGAIIIGLPKKILPLGQLSWSWKRARDRCIREFCEGVSYGLIFGLIFGLVFLFNGVLKFEQCIYWATNGLISGLIGGLILGLSSGLGSSEIEKQIESNQGIRSSLINCIFIGLIIALIGATIGALIGGVGGGLSGKLIFGPIFDVMKIEINTQTGAKFGFLVFGLIGGVIGGLKYGGAAYIQHFILRQMLCQKGRIPWNYAKFLDFASDRLLMRKVGGGYVFFHRRLLEHFAQMNSH